MKHRVVDLLLLVVLLIGGVWAWTSGRERGRLQVDHDRLIRAMGDLSIGDPTLLHVLALETGDPMHFAWRIYAPANYQRIMRSHAGSPESGSSTSSSSSSPEEFIARIRFKEDEDGVLELYETFGGGSSRGSIANKSIARLFHGRWDRLLVERLGAGKVATLEPDGRAVLLRITLPEDMQAEARQKLDSHDQGRLTPFFEAELGPETPKLKSKSTVPGK